MADTPEMVEHVARAMCVATDKPHEQWEFWIPEARAAIAAMREPTKTMLNKGEYVNSEWLNDGAPIGQAMYREPAKSVYRAMIDAALKE